MKRIIANVIFYGFVSSVLGMFVVFVVGGLYVDYIKHGWTGIAGVILSAFAGLVAVMALAYVMAWAVENKDVK
jgi:hypothetical protein